MTNLLREIESDVLLQGILDSPSTSREKQVSIASRTGVMGLAMSWHFVLFAFWVQGNGVRCGGRNAYFRNETKQLKVTEEMYRLKHHRSSSLYVSEEVDFCCEDG
jgi:hypothetical protein